MRHKRAPILLAASLAGSLALAGCATGPSLQSRMAGFTGASTQTLVEHLGVPDKQITTNGTQYLAYNVRHSEELEGGFYGPIGPYFGGGYYGAGFGGGFYDSSFPRPIDQYVCTTTFALRDDRVVGFTLKGNDCD
jgi:hypothetical protein